MNRDLVKIAYKKLKSSVYFDKTQLILRNALVEFETSNIDSKLDALYEKLTKEEEREKLVDGILSTISYNVFPKSLKDEKCKDEKNNKEEENKIITNYTSLDLYVKKCQYFINMSVEGHILGVLWLLLIGYKIDNDVYTNSYGNRIRKKLYNELSGQPTYSPYLFEPYFQQYESWRDKAMDCASNCLHNNEDVVILTLDFERFYYSVDMSEKVFETISHDYIEQGEDSEEILHFLNDFVYKVIEKYSNCFNNFESRNILPIGFLPSNVLANYALRNFDKAILDGWNPIYFGRYVDDVIIVDKIESTSDIYQKADKNELGSRDIINFFLKQCSAWRGIGKYCDNASQALFFENEKGSFVLNSIYNPDKANKYSSHKNKEKNSVLDIDSDNKSEIKIQNSKVNIFYFKAGQTDALITCFRNKISKNKSEFRHLPYDEDIFYKNDYNKIYNLNNEETLNKFRGIKGIDVDKFELSKFLGKYLRIGSMVSNTENKTFEHQIEKIFSSKVIIENYTVWEKVIEILVINESYDTLKKFVNMIIKAINCTNEIEEITNNNMHFSLLLYLESALSRSLALVWGKQIDNYIGQIQENEIPRRTRIQELRKSYLYTKMIDKSVVPVLLEKIPYEKILENDSLNLTNFLQVLSIYENSDDPTYKYYPYVITMYDLAIAECLNNISSGSLLDNAYDLYENQINQYKTINYNLPKSNPDSDVNTIDSIINVFKIQGNNIGVSVDNGKKKNIRIAVANVRLSHSNFENVIVDNPNRSYARYEELSKIINSSIDEKVDMLILPESYLPFEWLVTLARTCARSNIAVVTGIEHIKMSDKIYNLSAVILPYQDYMNKSAYISFHLKTHYAPSEKREIRGYRLKEQEGTNYELYKWYDAYFPLYCCYELTSINDRALFQSYADFIVAIEWNRDINYYSNILESLSRDLHCYCVQVNSSDYGDSRITRPAKTDNKDIIRTKGGTNSTILVGEIDIESLRNFQIKSYELQKTDSRYKATPPDFDHDIVMKKIKGQNLFEEKS